MKKKKSGEIEFGIVASGNFLFKGKQTFYFQSHYFREPNHLTLLLDDVEALSNDQYIEIDFSNKQILKNPFGQDLNIEILNDNSIKLQYQTNFKDNPFSNLLSVAVDQKGTSYNFLEVQTNDENTEELYHFDFQKAQNPMKIYFYDSYIYLKGKAKVEIPVE